MITVVEFHGVYLDIQLNRYFEYNPRAYEFAKRLIPKLNQQISYIMSDQFW